MTKPYNRYVTASVALMITGILAGCGSTQVSPTQGTGTTNTTINVADTPSNTSKNSGVSNITLPSQSSQKSATPVLTSLRMINSTVGWGTGRNTVWYTTDSGMHWTNVTPKGLKTSSNLQMKIYGIGHSNAWVAISGLHLFAMYHTTDQGQSWEKQQVHDEGTPISLHFTNQDDGWLALEQGAAAGNDRETIYQTDNGGSSWNKIAFTNEIRGGTLPFSGDKTGASFIDNNHGWATGDTHLNGRVDLYQTTDGGHTWISRNISVSSKLKNEELTSYPPIFFGQKDGILPVVSNLGLITYRTTDGGNRWTPTSVVQSQVQNGQINEWSFVSVNNGFATGGNQLFITRDGGDTWKVIQTNVSFKNVNELDFISSIDGWALTISGSLYHTTDGGHNWKKTS